MTEDFNELINSFNQAIQNKEKDKFSESDIKTIYDAATLFFRDDRSVSDEELNQIRDKWVALASEKIDKGRAAKKLHGTSRAESIKAVLQSML